MNISRYFVDSSSLDWAGSGCRCVCLLYAQHLAVVEGEDRAGGQRDAAGEADGLQPRPGLTQLKIYHRLQVIWQIMSKQYKGTTYWLKVPALYNIHEQAATAGSRVVLHLDLGPLLTLLSSVRINHLCNHTIYCNI